MKRAQELALKKQDPKNKEFWEAKLTAMENLKKQTIGQLEEVNFLIDCYNKKIETFK